ncbi:helix-turn-helix transcriptional regulator [Effusibacillus consociatus]|uniref:Helix-turn-helix transcriptional regulator n=1 Tax=Effusibacillus consociatus TaxID=1117041 RepID=A0ABV9Q3L3_9BACL
MRRERLSKERASRNLTQEQVAMEIGISTIYLRKLEGGQSKPGRETMLKLEHFYGVPARDLFPDIFSGFSDSANNPDHEG